MSDHCRSPVEPLSLIRVVSRRNFVLGGAAAVAVAMMLRAGAVAAGEDTSQPTADVAAPPEEAAAGRIPVSSGLTHSRQFDEALQSILADAEPVVGEPLTLELPELAENGNVVPYTVRCV